MLPKIKTLSKFVVALTMFGRCAFAQDITAQQINQLRDMFEEIIAGANYRHEHNYCRIIKNLGRDAVSCDIYQTFSNNSGNQHSELATKIDLEYIENEEASLVPPMKTQQINNYNIKIWQDKIYAGPKRPAVLMTTYVVKLSDHLKLTMTCWEGHKCYAEKLVEQLNKQNITKITRGK